MKIAIIGAMKDEINLLDNIITNKIYSYIGNYQIIYGKCNNFHIALLLSGIGKVSAAISTTILIEKFSPTVIINVGCAGSLTSKLKIGDIAISTHTCYYDVDLSIFGYHLGQVPECPLLFNANAKLVKLIQLCIQKLQYNYLTGTICTGDKFLIDINNTRYINKMNIIPIAVDMEGAAISHVCYRFNIPFIVLRVISDVVNTNSYLLFKQQIKLINIKIFNIIKMFLSNNHFYI
uniref:adenosylhomocysteine nucleosidase n=1 Tax=Candidatus Aschnera chinzeii TaxID=1485666 RepID=A0AAT9G566_9ENTR|nr:MAG: 5'-methylthioadenosine/S-adenosylhomocysteine nucleosidase [Candidatus Aschnera chinzeii]